jgi:hypothetical protein
VDPRRIPEPRSGTMILASNCGSALATSLSVKATPQELLDVCRAEIGDFPWSRELLGIGLVLRQVPSTPDHGNFAHPHAV